MPAGYNAGRGSGPNGEVTYADHRAASAAGIGPPMPPRRERLRQLAETVRLLQQIEGDAPPAVESPVREAPGIEQQTAAVLDEGLSESADSPQSPPASVASEDPAPAQQAPEEPPPALPRSRRRWCPPPQHEHPEFLPGPRRHPEP